MGVFPGNRIDMQHFGLAEGEAIAGLRSLKAVALADGEFDDHERHLIEACARALHASVDCDDLEACTPEDAASAVSDPVHRERLIQAQIVTAIIDGEASPKETEVIRSFAKALDVDEPRLANLSSVAKGHLRYVQFDLMRRSKMVSDVVRKAWREQGLSGAYKQLAPMTRKALALDPKLAGKYLAFEELPENTFGRAYYEHMIERGFSFPGQEAGFPEGFMKHDFCHVLGDYDTDPAGECEVIAFICGFMKADPFSYLFMIALHCHLGINIFEGDATGEFQFHPDDVLESLERGMAVRRDLYDVDFDWEPYFERPLDEMRAELGVLPKKQR